MILLVAAVAWAVPADKTRRSRSATEKLESSNSYALGYGLYGGDGYGGVVGYYDDSPYNPSYPGGSYSTTVPYGVPFGSYGNYGRGSGSYGNYGGYYQPVYGNYNPGKLPIEILSAALLNVLTC